MSVSRRKFLGMGGLLVAATAAPSQVLPGLRSPKQEPAADKFPARIPAEVVQLDYVTKETYRKYLNTNFDVEVPAGGKIRMTLISVTTFDPTGDLRGKTTNAPRTSAAVKRTDSFALRFRGPGNTILPQGTYAFEHVSLGRFVLFIVPMSAGQPFYTAVFSRA